MEHQSWKTGCSRQTDRGVSACRAAQRGGAFFFFAVEIGFGIQRFHKFFVLFFLRITRISTVQELRPKAWNILVLMPAP